jgi:hypothetical protein
MGRQQAKVNVTAKRFTCAKRACPTCRQPPVKLHRVSSSLARLAASSERTSQHYGIHVERNPDHVLLGGGLGDAY